MDAPALQRCVGDVDRFFRDHWAARPLLRRHSSNESFDDLASLDDLDRMIASLGLKASSLRMVESGKTLPADAYTTAPGGTKARHSEPAINPSLVYERFYDGATIALEGLHRYWAPLADFCRELEVALGHRLQVNAYITPPGSQGFDVHRDDHDVFVLQVSGSKHWLVYAPEDEDRPLIDATLARGDVLYIPTGWPHAAVTGTGASAHLTVGILTHDGVDVLKEVVKLAEDEPLWRERLDLRGVEDDARLRSLVADRLDELRTWLDKVDVDEVTERLARRVLSTAQPLLRGQLTQLELLDSIDGETTLARRSGSICVVRRREDRTVVLLVDRELEMPGELLEVMQHISGVKRLRVRDLDSFVDRASAIVLARRLVREGLLEVVVA